MPQVRIHDNVASRQFEMRIYFLEEEDRWVVGSTFPYDSDKAKALAAVREAAQEAADRLHIPWVQSTQHWSAGS